MSFEEIVYGWMHTQTDARMQDGRQTICHHKSAPCHYVTSTQSDQSLQGTLQVAKDKKHQIKNVYPFEKKQLFTMFALSSRTDMPEKKCVGPYQRPQCVVSNLVQQFLVTSTGSIVELLKV